LVSLRPTLYFAALADCVQQAILQNFNNEKAPIKTLQSRHDISYHPKPSPKNIAK